MALSVPLRGSRVLVPRGWTLGHITRMATNSTITTVRGRAYRIALIAMWAMFASIPIHYVFHRWEMSNAILGFVFILLLVILVSSVIARRFGPLAGALLAILLHSLSAFA